MTRDTSLEAYNTIRSKGLLSKARMTVYGILAENGPLTAGEVFEVLQRIDSGHTVVKGSVCARLTELQRFGVVQEVGRKEWSKTGHANILWDVTGNLPSPVEKKKTKDQMIKELKEQVTMLRERLENFQKENPKQLELI